MKKEWSKEEEQFIVDNFEKMSNKEIANSLNRNVSSIKMKAKRLNVKRKSKYQYNKNFFETIDSEEKAYWLGFIYADVWICLSKTNAEVRIQLKDSDYEHLKKFNKSIEGNIEVNRLMTTNGFGIDKEYPSCSIRIYWKKLALALEKNGPTKNKITKIQLLNL